MVTGASLLQPSFPAAVPGQLGGGTPIFAAQGNHGFTTHSPYLQNFPQANTVAASGGTYSSQSYCCAAGTSGTTSYASAWYAFTWGNARFYILEAAWADPNGDYQGDFTSHWNGPVAGCTPCGQEKTWLANDLAANASVPLKFAFFHYPLYADDNNQPGDTYLQGRASSDCWRPTTSFACSQPPRAPLRAQQADDLGQAAGQLCDRRRRRRPGEHRSGAAPSMRMPSDMPARAMRRCRRRTRRSSTTSSSP